MKKQDYIAIAIILIFAGLLIINIPNITDWYITNQAPTDYKDCYNGNCIIQGKYNITSIDMDYWSISLDRRISTEWLYKECNHNIGDDVRYFGQMNNGKFIIRRELC